jgi:hypothetical protein
VGSGGSSIAWRRRNSCREITGRSESTTYDTTAFAEELAAAPTNIVVGTSLLYADGRVGSTTVTFTTVELLPGS